MLPEGFPKTMPGKRVCRKPLWYRLILERLPPMLTNGSKADIANS